MENPSNGHRRQQGYYVYVTEACNLRCSYCFVSDKSNQRHMPQVTAEQVLSYIARDAPDCGKIYVHFFGGEPLVRPQTIDFLAGQLRSWSDSQGIRLRLGITTNGTLLTIPNCEMLRGHEIGVQLSLDGSKQGNDIHRQLMGGTQFGLPAAGAFDLVRIDNYIHYFGKGRPNCRMTLTVHNLPYLARSIEELHGLGFKSFSVIPDADCGQWTPAHFAQYETEMSKVFEYWSSHTEISVNAIEQTIGKLVEKKEHSHLCPAGKSIVGITVDGDIYPCHDFAGKFAADPSARSTLLLGSVASGTTVPRAAYERVPLSEVKSGNGHDCATCWARWACARGCPYMNYAHAGDIRVANATYCTATRIYASLALRWMSALGRFRFLDVGGVRKPVARRHGATSGDASVPLEARGLSGSVPNGMQGSPVPGPLVDDIGQKEDRL